MSILLSKSKLLQPAANEPFELEKCFKKYVSFEGITDYGILVQISDNEETLQNVILTRSTVVEHEAPAPLLKKKNIPFKKFFIFSP